MSLVNIILILLPLALLSFICAMLCFCALALANVRTPEPRSEKRATLHQGQFHEGMKTFEEIVMMDGSRWQYTSQPDYGKSPGSEFTSAQPLTNLRIRSTVFPSRQ